MLEATTKAIPDNAQRPRLVVALWAAFGITLAISGILGRTPQLGPAYLAASVVVWSLAYRRSRTLRAWVDALPQRALIALHVLRLPIGVGFLVDSEVPRLFAHRAGYGDIAVGALAIGVAAFASQHRRIVLAFSVIGFADIVLAVGTGMYLLFGFRDPGMLAAFGKPYYALLPLLIVPTVLLTHLAIIARNLRYHTARS